MGNATPCGAKGCQRSLEIGGAKIDGENHVGKREPNKNAKELQMMITNSEMKPEDLIKRYPDLLEMGRPVSWCTNRIKPPG